MRLPEEVVAISEIGNDFHKAGVLEARVITGIYELTRDMDISNTLETGCGKSTLLFSHISKRHLCFTLGASDSGGDDQSLSAVKDSLLFNSSVVQFVTGPTQKTLPAYKFAEKFQVIFIDGPHGFPFPNIEYYFLYPHLENGGLLILDDIHIPTIAQLYDFLKEDEMFFHLKNVGTTAFFQRTDAALFDPYGDNWWLQSYNKKRFAALSEKYSSRGIKTRIHAQLAKLFGARFADTVRATYLRVFR